MSALISKLSQNPRELDPRAGAVRPGGESVLHLGFCLLSSALLFPYSSPRNHWLVACPTQDSPLTGQTACPPCEPQGTPSTPTPNPAFPVLIFHALSIIHCRSRRPPGFCLRAFALALAASWRPPPSCLLPPGCPGASLITSFLPLLKCHPCLPSLLMTLSALPPSPTRPLL